MVKKGWNEKILNTWVDLDDNPVFKNRGVYSGWNTESHILPQHTVGNNIITIVSWKHIGHVPSKELVAAAADFKVE